MVSVDLKNVTLYPNIDEFFGFSKIALVYMYIASTLPDLFALVGNFIVLYTSLKYKSFNLNKITVTLLENLAVADMLLIIVGLVPMDIVMFTKTWTLGPLICALNGYVTIVFGSAEVYILTSMSVYRIALLQNSFRFREVKIWKRIVWVTTIWVVACIPTIYGLATETSVYYDPFMFSCTSSGYAEDSSAVIIFTGVLLAIPLVAMVIANTMILVIAVRYKARMIRQGSTSSTNRFGALVTVGCICWMFIISWIPYGVRIMAESQSYQLPKWFYIFQTHVLRLNVVMNPIIYTFTNKSFKECVKLRVINRILLRSRRRRRRISSIYGNASVVIRPTRPRVSTVTQMTHNKEGPP